MCQAAELEHARRHLSHAEALSRLADLHELDNYFANFNREQPDEEEDSDPDYEPVLDRWSYQQTFDFQFWLNYSWQCK